MRVSFYAPFTISATLIASSSALVDPQLTGTWSTKSNKVFTGPAFYDPVNEKFTEPSLTGISYSFTSDGFYEEAYYRAISNPTQPSCPGGIMQFQHGTYTKSDNGSLILEPFAVDGRQLESNPCNSQNAVYTRYNQSELFKSYQILTDPYHNVLRLNLFKFDGSPMNPMYLAFNPPQMLPTITLNPTATAKPTGNVKRGHYEMSAKPMNHKVMNRRKDTAGADRLWWIGVFMTLLGALGYLCFD